MSRSYACIISPDVNSDRSLLLSIAHQFSYSIETLEDGIIFDISGLERLIGNDEKIAHKVLAELKQANIPGSVAIAGTVEAATLLARQQSNCERSLHLPDTFSQLPLDGFEIEEDTLNIFNDLGLKRVEDLLAIPQADLIDRYGREFENVIRAIRQKGDRLLTPNVKEKSVAWSYELDHTVEDFEQLIFILNHGLDTLFRRVAYYGLSTEHLDISFRLSNKTKRGYVIKTSFPTLERSFWLKLVNLRVSLDPPEAGIVSLEVVSYFTKPRPSQRGLYAVSRPEPENLLLTVNKLKKLVGESNVGVPVLLDQRLASPFDLDADSLPLFKHQDVTPLNNHSSAIVAFSYYHPPMNAEVLVRDGRLVFVRTRSFSGRVLEYSGVWRANSKWWERPWRSHEWDIEIENGGLYRISKIEKEWFVVGEYD